MNATEVVRHALEMSDKLANTMLEDMREAPLTQPTARGGNHPLWVVGHLAFSEGQLYQMMTGERNPLVGWSKFFAGGTEPSADAGHYPKFDEVFGKYRQLRAATLKRLDGMDDAALDRPAPSFGTVGKALTAIAMH